MGYFEYVINRIIAAVFVLISASIVIFSILRLTPGDPAALMLGVDATESAIEYQRRRLGLDLPVWEQYLHWVGQILTLNMGTSILTGTSIQDLLFIRYPRSFILAMASMAIATLIAVPLGVIGALNRNTKIDYAALLFSQFGISLPNFVLGIYFIMIFAAWFNVLPSSGYVSPFDSVTGFIAHITLPALTIGIINAAIITRFVRSEMLEQLHNDYVRTARAMGHPEKRVIRKYTLRNALIPTLTVLGLQFGSQVAGLVVVEQVFSFPGMGLLILDGLFARDYPVLQIGLLVIAATYIVVNLLVDLLYGYLDPRIKY